MTLRWLLAGPLVLAALGGCSNASNVELVRDGSPLASDEPEAVSGAETANAAGKSAEASAGAPAGSVPGGDSDSLDRSDSGIASVEDSAPGDDTTDDAGRGGEPANGDDASGGEDPGDSSPSVEDDSGDVGPATGGSSGVAASRLSVGECALESDDSEFVAVGCGQAHDVEIFHRITVSESSWPGEEALFDLADPECLDAFGPYVGIDYGFSVFGFTVALPTEADFVAGDRTLVCLLSNYDGSQKSGSAEGTEV